MSLHLPDAETLVCRQTGLISPSGISDGLVKSSRFLACRRALHCAA